MIAVYNFKATCILLLFSFSQQSDGVVQKIRAVSQVANVYYSELIVDIQCFCVARLFFCSGFLMVFKTLTLVFLKLHYLIEQYFSTLVLAAHFSARFSACSD